MTDRSGIKEAALRRESHPSFGVAARRAVPRASPQLAAAIEVLAEGSGGQSDPTLGEVRAIFQKAIWSMDGELLFPQDRTALVIELDELIDACGAQESASGFVARRTE